MCESAVLRMCPGDTVKSDNVKEQKSKGYCLLSYVPFLIWTDYTPAFSKSSHIFIWIFFRSIETNGKIDNIHYHNYNLNLNVDTQKDN